MPNAFRPFMRGAAGEMAEWLKAHAWKACVRETVPWVRIPLSPPTPFQLHRRIGRIIPRNPVVFAPASTAGCPGESVKKASSGHGEWIFLHTLCTSFKRYIADTLTPAMTLGVVVSNPYPSTNSKSAVCEFDTCLRSHPLRRLVLTPGTAGLREFVSVSALPIRGAGSVNCRKSPTNSAKTPVLGDLGRRLWFDQPLRGDRRSPFLEW